MASSEELNNHTAKILVEACMNISFDVAIEMKGQKAIIGRIHAVDGKFDHDRQKASAAILFRSANSEPRWLDTIDIDRIARAPSSAP